MSRRGSSSGVMESARRMTSRSRASRSNGSLESVGVFSILGCAVITDVASRRHVLAVGVGQGGALLEGKGCTSFPLLFLANRPHHPFLHVFHAVADVLDLVGVVQEELEDIGGKFTLVGDTRLL